MFKYNEYYCMSCKKSFPIGNLYTFQDNCYKDIIHEKCPLCGSVDMLADVYDDIYASGKLLVPHTPPKIMYEISIHIRGINDNCLI